MKETLKEALDRNYKEAGHHAYFGNGFERGVSWQAERSYSEEDLEKAYQHGSFSIIDHGHGETFKEWFKKFKKK